MSNPFTTVPLTEEQLGQFTNKRIVAVRLFQHPHFWYAGILLDCTLTDVDTLTIDLKSSVRFEREGKHDGWFAGDSLIKPAIDHGVFGTKNKEVSFILTEATNIIHSTLERDGGIMGIKFAAGFAHLSYRLQDVMSVGTLIEKKVFA